MQEMQEVGDAIIEGLNVEEPAVVDPNNEQEVGEEGIECPSEDVPDVVDAKHVQEAQEVSDAIIEGLNVEEPEISDVRTGTVDCEVFEEVVCDNGYRRGGFFNKRRFQCNIIYGGYTSPEDGNP